ncbi:MAG: hypothetical protein ACI8S6_003142 [Myxococcota bacterium]|jgi:hypothetical protein
MLQRALILSLVLTSTAFAQQDEVTDEPTPVITYRDVTILDIDSDLEIEGTLVRPEVLMMSGVKRGQFASMISLRTDFNSEMSSSVEEIR